MALKMQNEGLRVASSKGVGVIFNGSNKEKRD